MFFSWMKFSLDAARLGYEMQTVMALRMLKLARAALPPRPRRSAW
jgi:hypothetical protein